MQLSACFVHHALFAQTNVSEMRVRVLQIQGDITGRLGSAACGFGDVILEAVRQIDRAAPFELSTRESAPAKSRPPKVRLVTNVQQIPAPLPARATTGRSTRAGTDPHDYSQSGALVPAALFSSTMRSLTMSAAQPAGSRRSASRGGSGRVTEEPGPPSGRLALPCTTPSR
jgi:hypothetical protein